MIDRQKIMSDLEGLTFDDWHMYHSDTEVQGIAIDALELLKSQPEQKHGHWKQVEAGFTDMMCSECGELALLDLDRDFVLSKFCPNCGAKMDGEVKQE